MAATKEVQKTSFCTKVKTLFRMRSCSEKVFEKIFKKNQDVFDFVKLKSHIVNMILNHLDLYDNVKMAQVNIKLHQHIHNRLGIELSFAPCNLNRSPMTKQDLFKLCRYAYDLGHHSRTYPFSDHVYLKKFMLTDLLDSQTIMDAMTIYSPYDRANRDKITSIAKKVRVPVRAIMSDCDGQTQLEFQIDRWRCERITDGELSRRDDVPALNLEITFVSKAKPSHKLVFGYFMEDFRFPHYVTIIKEHFRFPSFFMNIHDQEENDDIIYKCQEECKLSLQLTLFYC